MRLVRNSSFIFKRVSNSRNDRKKPERGIPKPEGTFKEIEKRFTQILIVLRLHSRFLNTSHKYLISLRGLSAAILFHACNIHLPVITAVPLGVRTPPQTFFWQGEFQT